MQEVHKKGSRKAFSVNLERQISKFPLGTSGGYQTKQITGLPPKNPGYGTEVYFEIQFENQ